MKLDPRAWRSREALRLALMILLERKSLNQIIIRDITDQAGVGYATFFRHYETKDALLNDLAADEIHRLVHLALPLLKGSNASDACLALCAYVDTRRVLWSALLTGGAAGTVREAFLRAAQQTAASFPEPGGWLSKELGVAFAVSAIIEVLSWWLRQSAPVPIEQVAEAMDRLAIRPLTPF